MSRDLTHVPLLNLATELLPQFMGAELDDRVMGHTDDGPIGPIQGHLDLGCLTEQVVKFFLETARDCIHELLPSV